MTVFGIWPHFQRALQTAACIAALLVVFAVPLHAQQPAFQQPNFRPAVPGAQPGARAIPRLDFDLRLYIVILDQFSFVTHPFYQVTQQLPGSEGYADGKSASANMFNMGIRDSDANANVLVQLIHALPPFGIEGVTATPFPFPRGFGIGFDHFMFPMRDAELARGTTTVLPIKMDTYMYSGTLRFYVFDPTQAGLNYFFGFGVGILSGNLTAEPFAGVAEEIISFAQAPVGSTRMGLETRSDNWGFRYELVVINADAVTLDSNPYCSPSPCDGATVIDMSGTTIRMAFMYHFD